MTLIGEKFQGLCMGTAGKSEGFVAGYILALWQNCVLGFHFIVKEEKGSSADCLHHRRL